MTSVVNYQLGVHRVIKMGCTQYTTIIWKYDMQDLGQSDPKFLSKLGEYVAQNPKTHTSTVLLHLPPSIYIVSLTRTSSPNEKRKKKKRLYFQMVICIMFPPSRSTCWSITVPSQSSIPLGKRSRSIYGYPPCLVLWWGCSQRTKLITDS